VALLEIARLRKSYVAPEAGPQTILDIDKFDLDDGAQLALSGTSGSGKTTLLQLIAGITTPDSGTVRLNQTDIFSLSEPERDRFRARNVGYIFQTFNLLPAYTCLENVLLAMSFAGTVDHARAEALLKRVGLADRLKHRPHQLSTGQQQRIAVARALANRPKLVLADEPTGNLDAHNGRQTLALIRETCAETGAALLCVSHDPAVLAGFEQTRSLTELNRVEATAERAK
jgi:ABC-type lipoprotein export system ATPase subunit